MSEVTVLALLALLVVSSGDSRNSQEGVVGVSVPDQQLLVRRDRLRRKLTSVTARDPCSLIVSQQRATHTVLVD